MVEERSLKVLSNDTTFFSKVSNTLTKLLTPTKIGINGMMINIKRSSAIKNYELFKASEETSDVAKKDQCRNRYEESYTLYLESIDKHIMDSIYKKVKNNYKLLTSTEEGKLLYGIFKKWKLKYQQPTAMFKKNVIDAGIKFFPEITDKDNAFEYFYRWAMLNGFSKENMFLERRDYSKDFSGKNCLWTNNKTKGY